MRCLPAVVPFVAASIATAQQTQAIFDAPVVAVDAFSRIDELADLDLDGDLDGFGIYVNQTTSSSQQAYLQAKLHRNDGSGRFTWSVLYQWTTTAGTPTDYRSAVGDIDGDGHADVLTVVGADLWIVESRAGQPTVRTLTPMPLSVSLMFDCDLRLLDVTGDGRAELVVLDTFYGLRAFNLGTVNYTQRGIASPNPSSTELAPIEANGDAAVDLAVLDGGIVRLYPANQTGLFASFASFVLPPGISSYGGMQGNLVAGDIDGDQDQDLVVFSIAGQYCWLERTGPAQFVVHVAATGGPATHLHDLDGDGDLDGTCCGGGGGPTTTSPNDREGAFEIAQNLGGGVFAPSWRMPSIGPFHLAGCADVDGDGRKDLVGGRCVWFGRGRHDPVAAVLPPVTNAHLVDVDRDGDQDLVDLGNNQRTNRGDGTFSTSQVTLPPPPAGSTWDVRPGPVDFDGDGDSDLLVRRSVGGTPVATHWLANAGGGLFVDRGPVTPAGTSMTGTEPVFAGDLDGDGDLDLVHTETSPAFVTRAWLQTNGTLTAGPTWPTQRVVGVADMTHDGRADVLLASYPFPPAMYWMNLAVAVAQPGGTFTALAIGMFPSLDRIGIVDLDGDTHLDLVLADVPMNLPLLAVRYGTGQGLFGSSVTLATASLKERARLFVADLDRDGRLDIVAGPAGYPDIVAQSLVGTWVLRQPSPGQFQALLYSTEIGQPADSDGDGDLDLLGRAAVRNTRFDGQAAGQREQFGFATAGSGGARPTLGAVGPFRVGATMASRLTGGLGQGFAFVAASLAPANPAWTPLPGFTVWLDNPFVLATFVLGGAPLAPGEGSGEFALALPASAAGLEFYEQAFVFDPAVAGLGVVHSGALRIRVGW